MIAFIVAFCVFVVVVLIIVLSGNKSNTNNANTASGTANPSPATANTGATTAPSTKAAQKLELVGETTTENNGYMFTINGALRNNTGKQYLYVQITFGVYDAGGSKLGTALANVNNLGPGETWKFSAVYFGTIESGGTYKLDDITAY
jgi:hypothetical protein